LRKKRSTLQIAENIQKLDLNDVGDFILEYGGFIGNLQPNHLGRDQGFETSLFGMYSLPVESKLAIVGSFSDHPSAWINNI
jgi:hypothetical protein